MSMVCESCKIPITNPYSSVCDECFEKDMAIIRREEQRKEALELKAFAEYGRGLD